MKFIKEAYKYYRELKIKDKEKNKLLSADLNYKLLQEIVNKAANNPGLVIEINLKSGDRLLIKTQEEERIKTISDYINGVELVE